MADTQFVSDKPVTLDCEDTNNLCFTPSDEELVIQYLNSLGEVNYHSLFRDLLKVRHKGATTFKNTNMDPALANNEITEKCIQKSLQYFQNVQEERVILSIGSQEFHTSRVTLRADPNSVLAVMLRKDSPMRPCGNTYYFDRDPSHFRCILNCL